MGVRWNSSSHTRLKKLLEEKKQTKKQTPPESNKNNNNNNETKQQPKNQTKITTEENLKKIKSPRKKLKKTNLVAIEIPTNYLLRKPNFYS